MTQEQRDKALTDALVEVKAMAVDNAILRAKLLENIALSTRALLARETLVKVIEDTGWPDFVEIKRRFTRILIGANQNPWAYVENGGGVFISKMSLGEVTLIASPINADAFVKSASSAATVDYPNAGHIVYEIPGRGDYIKLGMPGGVRAQILVFDDGL